MQPNKDPTLENINKQVVSDPGCFSLDNNSLERKRNLLTMISISIDSTVGLNYVKLVGLSTELNRIEVASCPAS